METECERENEVLLEDSKNQEKAENTGQKTGFRWKEIALFLVVLCMQCGTAISESFMFPFFPIEADKRQLTQTHIGLVFSAYEVGRFLTSPIAGSLVAKVTPRAMLILAGILSSTACIALGLMDYVENKHVFLTLTVIGRFVAGSGISMVCVAGTSLLLKATSFQTGTIVSGIEGVIGGGYILGPAVGVAIYQVGGYSVCFYAFGGFMAAVTFLQVLALPDTEDNSKKEKHFFHLMKIPGIALMFAHYFVVTFGISARYVTFPVFLLHSLDSNTTTIALIMGLSPLIYMAFCPLAGFLMNKGIVYSGIIVGWILQGFVSLLFGPSPLLNFVFHHNQSLLLSAVCWGMFQVLTTVIYLAPFQVALNCAQAAGYEKDSIHTYGMVAGMVNSAQGLGSIVGPIAGGAVVESIGFPWAMSVIAFLYFGMAIFLSVFLLYTKHQKIPLTPS